MFTISTSRLLLRLWKEGDIDAYYQINQNPDVLEFLPGALTRTEVKNFMARQNQQFVERGFALWAAELKETSDLIGFIGLNYFDYPVHFSPAVEIGWRLSSSFWGKGYATEGARKVIEFGFHQCHLQEIVAFTVPKNIRSQRVMEKIGMVQDMNGDFFHPKLPRKHRLAKHVLYRITSENAAL